MKLTAHDLVDEFDQLMIRARKSGVLTTIQINRMADHMTREVATLYATEERVAKSIAHYSKPGAKPRKRNVPIVGSAP